MANNLLTIGRGRRAKDSNDELALQEIVMKLKGMVTAGEDAPGADTPGTMYFQYAADSMTRPWIKVNGVWK
jgi:hypothetical protein